MANISANILSVDTLSLGSDKGNLVFVVLNIDKEIIAHDTININDTLLLPACSCIYVNNGYSSALPITGSTFKYIYDSDSGYINFYVGSETSPTQTYAATGRGVIMPLILKGTNNVYYPFASEWLRVTGRAAYITTLPTSTMIGSYYYPQQLTTAGGTTILESYLERMALFISSALDSDPYGGAGDSETGGGDGTFDGSSDPVPVPSLPSIGATDTGFISLFVPSASQIRQVASYLWSNFFDLATFKKLFEDPMDCILGLSVVPVSVPTSGSAQITVGNVELSGISLPLASQQYVEVDCGTVDFTNRYFGSYLDFEPYTKMSLFVPYSGVHAVSADDIIGKVVGLKYHIDILTGSLVAFLTCGNSVLYEFNGACASNIPVNSMNYASTIENAIRIAVNIGTTVATAGAAAPATAAGEGAKLAVSGTEVGRAIALGGSTAQGALSLKPSIDRAGSLGGTTGLMGNQIPYFIITRPRMCKPKNQDVFQGYPSFIQTTLGDMEGTGFTAFENVILAGSYLTDTEKSELESILTAGVYL